MVCGRSWDFDVGLTGWRLFLCNRSSYKGRTWTAGRPHSIRLQTSEKNYSAAVFTVVLNAQLLRLFKACQ